MRVGTVCRFQLSHMPGGYLGIEVGSSELNRDRLRVGLRSPAFGVPHAHRQVFCPFDRLKYAAFAAPRYQIMPATIDVKDFALQLISTALGCSRNKDQRSCHFPDELKEEGRLAWGSVGDIIEAAPFLPITINVPDMIYGMYEMFHRVMDYFFGSDTDNASTPRIWEILQEVEDALPDI